MNYLDHILGGDWHIRPQAGLSLMIAAAREWQTGTREHGPIAKRPEFDSYGDELPKMRMNQGVAYVPISGPLMKGASGFEKSFFGVASHDDIHADLEAAVVAKAKAIVLEMNSPGGSVLGTHELAAHVHDLRAKGIPVTSSNANVSASAAEYISASAYPRQVSPSSINGSIGTIMQVTDASKLLERLGIAVNLFTSGKFKGMGHPASPLSDEQRDFLQSFVSSRGAEFAGWMTAHRPAMPASAMEGQPFTGAEAISIGLADAMLARP